MEPPSRTRVSVIDETGRSLDTEPIRAAAEAALSLGQKGAVCVLLTDDARLRELNLKFRGIDEATDVLTFPSSPSHPYTESLLGDIAIAVPFAEKQAEIRAIPLTAELQYLAIHGVLHLLGYEDEEECDRRIMFEEMHRVGRILNLPEERQWMSLFHEGHS